MNKTQKGFALLEIFLITLILVVVILGGYLVWSNTRTKSNLTKKSTQTQVANTQKNLYIKEWGVRASYSGSQALRYTIDSSSSFAYIDSPDLVAADPNCAIAATIQRALPSDFVNETQTAKQYAASSKTTDYAYINGYYYFYNYPHSTCSPKQSAEELETTVNAEVMSLVPKLHA